jgi:hypothetical protein
VISLSLCSVFDSRGHLSIMPETVREHSCEAEALLDSIEARELKRFHLEERDRFLHMLQLDTALIKIL